MTFPTGKFQAVSIADIHSWFCDYYVTKQRKRPVPTAQQCKEIADYINRRQRSTRMVTDSFRDNSGKINNILALEKQAEQEAASLLITLKQLNSRWDLFIEPMKADERNSLEGEAAKQRKLRADVEQYLVGRQLNSPGRAKKAPILIFHNFLQQKIKAAMLEAGWTTVSFTQNGPAPFVLAKCLEHLGGSPVNPATISRRLKKNKPKTG